MLRNFENVAKAMKKADSLPVLTPEVKWAQNPEAISLTISIGQVMRPGKLFFKLKI